jgi:hypothetical protein
MDKLLDTCNQPELNQEDINHLNSRITCNEIEAVIKSLPTKKTQDSLPNFTKEELTPIPLRLFFEIERKGKLPNSFLVKTINH